MHSTVEKIFDCQDGMETLYYFYCKKVGKLYSMSKFNVEKENKIDWEVKGVFSKPSGKYIVSPNPCFLS